MSPQSRFVLRMLVIVGTLFCVSHMDPSFPTGKGSASGRNMSLRPEQKVLPFGPIIWISDEKAHGLKTYYSPKSGANAASLHDTIDRVTMSGINSEDRMNGDKSVLQDQTLSVKRTSEKRLIENNQIEGDQNSNVEYAKSGFEREIIRTNNVNDGNDGGEIYTSYLRLPGTKQKQCVRTERSPNTIAASSVIQRVSEKQFLSGRFSQKKSTSRSLLELTSSRKFLDKLSTSREFSHKLFRSRDSLQKQNNSRKFSHKTSKGVLERVKRSGSFSSQLTSRSSCKGKCGGTQALPCRCDTQCLVYGNCCEDFDQDCPRIVKLAKAKWTDNLLSAETTCTSKSSVFMVTSCHAALKWDVTQSSNEGFLQNQSNNTPHLKKIKELDIVMDLVRNAPVTDATTGIVFRNRSIFNCYAGPDSIAVVWGVHIPYTKQGLGPPSSVDEIKQLLDTSEAYYAVDTSMGFIPSMSHDFGGAPCKSASIGTCNPRLDNVTAIARERCPQLISYVADFSNGAIYNNEYCLWCNLGATEKVYTDKISLDVKHMLRFNLLLDVTDTDFNAKIIGTGNFDALNSFPWKTFQCPFQGEKSSCHTVECLSAYTLIDGVCTTKHVLEIIFVVYQTSLPTRELKLLSNITECVLKDFFDSDYLSTKHLSRRKISNMTETETYVMEVKFQTYHIASVLDNSILTSRIQQALYLFSISNRDRHCPQASSSTMDKLDVNNVSNNQETWNNETGHKKEAETNAEKKEKEMMVHRNTFSFCMCTGIKKNKFKSMCAYECDTSDFRIPFNESAIYSPPKHCVKSFMSPSGCHGILIPLKKSCLYRLLVCLFVLQILGHDSLE